MENERDEEITVAELERILSYDKDTGEIKWIKPTSSRVKAGDLWGSVDDRGYRAGRVFGAKWYAHQIAFFLSHGYIPYEIDHIDRNKSNNRLANLRSVSRGDNGRNRDPYGETGIKGVYVDKRDNRIYARIVYDGYDYYLGSFASKELAEQAVINKYKQFNSV